MAGGGYRGRIAPSPTGYLHLGHARTFWIAHARARNAGGRVIYRTEDLDGPRCRPEFVAAAVEDLRWLGLTWDEGEDCGGPHAPYSQSERYDLYRAALLTLVRQGMAYPCYCSRKDIQRASSAPHEGEDEVIYPGNCRPPRADSVNVSDWPGFLGELNRPQNGRLPCWRFRNPVNRVVEFDDVRLGQQAFRCGDSFGDFVIWRRDNVCSYQLACVVDDDAMGITEVVRGADLLVSTARQILLRECLGLAECSWCHCDLMRDESGVRLAKRDAAKSLRVLREEGAVPKVWQEQWANEFSGLIEA